MRLSRPACINEPVNVLLSLHSTDFESDVLRATVESRIQRWYPLRHPYRSSFYEEVAAWPQDDEIQAILWCGLLDETDWNRLAAAESLAKVFGGEPAVADRLFNLFFKPSEPYLLDCALHALCLGWESDQRLPALLDATRFSADGELQSVALIHRVRRAEHDMKDREILAAFHGSTVLAHGVGERSELGRLSRVGPAILN